MHPSPRFPLSLVLCGALSVTACFAPGRQEQLSCSSEGACPDGLNCNSEKFCVDTVDEVPDANNLSSADANTTVSPDAFIALPDARPIPAELEPCTVGGNAVFFLGEPGNFIHPGTSLITDATFFASGSMRSVTLNLTPNQADQGSSWTLHFESPPNTTLLPGIYQNAVRPILAKDEPGIEVTGDGRGCNIIDGSFEIVEFEREGNTTTKLSVTFEQLCDANPSVLKGCALFKSENSP